MSDIKILDACCGSRMFWFDKNESHTTFMDIRQETFEIHGKKVNVNPDIIGDFRDMPFEDNTFNLVVFDPPHLKWAGENSILKAQYGQLDKVTWSEDLAKGFDECMRVLKVGGTLIFKWSDCQINVKKLLDVIPYRPLFGQQRGTTHWLTFVKFEQAVNMEWINYVEMVPQNKDQVIYKIENDGYTFPHYNKKRNRAHSVISVADIQKDCDRLGIELAEVYPLQTKLF